MTLNIGPEAKPLEMSFSIFDAGRVKIQWPYGMAESRFPTILREFAESLEAPETPIPEDL